MRYCQYKRNTSREAPVQGDMCTVVVLVVVVVGVARGTHVRMKQGVAIE